MNTANKLTILRIIMVPFFMFFMMMEGTVVNAIALVLFILASLTDWLDGKIARSRNQITTFGKFMDPLADKMLTTAAFVVLVADGRMSAWALMLVLVREFMVSGIRLTAASGGKVIAASMFGKIKTVAQMIAIIAALLLRFPIFTVETSVLITEVLIWISTVATVLSGIDYVAKNWNLLEFE